MFLKKEYVDIPGDCKITLPPIALINPVQTGQQQIKITESLLRREEEIVDYSTGLVLTDEIENRKYCLALNLAEAYSHMVATWCWGDALLKWFDECDEDSARIPQLRSVSHANIWPNPWRYRWAHLAAEKFASPEGIDVFEALGLRFIFAVRPSIDTVTDEFINLFKKEGGVSTYLAWERRSPDPRTYFPPERFEIVVETVESLPNI
jgi:hypothetical protein